MIIRILVTLMIVAGPAAAQLPPANTGRFYVSDYADDEVAVYGTDGSYLRSFSAPGLNGSRGVIVHPDGRLFVAGQLSNAIFVFDADEQPLGSFGHADLAGPTGMMRRGDELYVCSFNTDRVLVFDFDGAYLRQFTGGGMNGPNCAALDSLGNIYVSSAATASVIKFDADENLMFTFTGGGLSSPMGVARKSGQGGDDVLYVAGGASSNIVKFDTDGSTLGVITHPDLSSPQGVAFDDRGHMFSSSFSHDRIVEFDADETYVRTITAGDLDVPRSIAFVPMPIGDINDDGEVDFTDLLALLAAWGPCGIPCAADLDDNGAVDFNDLLIVLANWT